MILYADASALVKRYVAEEGSDHVARWVAGANQVACCRIGFVEVARAIMLAGLSDPATARQAFEQDWERIAILEVHDLLARRAVTIATNLRLRSLDSLHLAAAESLDGIDFQLMTWDRRLWRAAQSIGIQVLPEEEPGARGKLV